MLKQMRDVSKSLHWILWMVIASFVILIFWQWGMGGSGLQAGGGSEPWAARVGDQVITAREFFDTFERREAQLRQMLGAQYDRRTFMNPDAVVSDLIDQHVLRMEAKRMGLAVSAEELAEAIRDMPQFQGEGGAFDPKIYDDTLKLNRLTPDGFHAVVRDSLIVQKMEALLASAVQVPEPAVRKAWLEQVQTASLDYVLFPVDEAAAAAAPVTEAEARAHFDAHPERYDAGPARLIRWLKFDRESLQATLEDEAEMRAYYEQNLATNYTIGADQRRARHVLVAVDPLASAEDREQARAEAEQVAAAARRGEDFARLAREHSDDEATKDAGGDLGPFYQGLHDPAVDEAAFAMEVGEVRGPIETPAGFEILQLTKGAGEVARPFEEVRELVARGLYAAKAAEKAQATLEKFQEAYAEKSDFEAAAKAAGLEPSEPRWVSSGEIVPELGPNPALTARAFEAQVGSVTEPLPAEGGQAVLHVVEAREKSPRTFEAARADVERDVREEAARALARQQAEAAAAAVRAGTDLAAAVAPRVVQSATDVRHGQPVGELGQAPALVAAAFEAPVGQPGPIVDTPRGPVLFVVTARAEIDEAKFAEEAPAVRERLENQAYMTFRKESLGRLREAYEDSTSINEDVLARLRG